MKRAPTGGLSNSPSSSSIYHLLQAAAAKHGEKPALSFLETCEVSETPYQVNYSGFFGAVTQSANVFASLGVGAKDCVSLLLPSVPEMHFSLWGAGTVAIANPVNFLLTVDKLEEILIATNTNVLVALGPNPGLPIWEKAQTLCKRIPRIKHLIQVSSPSGRDPKAPDLWELMRDEPDDHLSIVTPNSGAATTCYFHTGGTTGSPKIVPHTHAQHCYVAEATSALFNFSAADTMLIGMPLFHVGGALAAGLAPLSAGVHLVMMSAAGLRNENAIQNYWDIGQRFNATIGGGVPTSIGALANTPSVQKQPGSFEFAISGGATLTIDVQNEFEENCRLPVKQIYGMTETSGLLTAASRYASTAKGSVGNPPQGTDILVADLDESGHLGSIKKTGEPGQILARGPGVFSGYLNPDHTRDAFTPEGWFRTGDLGYLDESGQLFITGRDKDIIIRSGHNIDPNLLEEAILSHPDVAACAAVGQLDAYAGEVPVIFVVPRPGALPNIAALQAWTEEEIAEPAARPREIYLVDALPITEIGKVYRPELRRIAAQHVVDDRLGNLRVAPPDMLDVTLTLDGRSGALTAHLDTNKIDPSRYETCFRDVSAALSGLPIDLRKTSVSTQRSD